MQRGNVTNRATRSLAALLAVAFTSARPLIAETSIMLPIPPLSSGVTIGRVNVNAESIFDLQNPDENSALYRVANKLHMTTRDGVIYQQLLFSSGDQFSTQALEESERILRTNRYIQNVQVRPVAFRDGVVDVEVTTSDVWTLIPKLSLSRSGGENKTAIGIKEMNLFGTGIAVEVAHKSDVDRDSTSVKYLDRNVGESWYSLGLYIADNSDGHSTHAALKKPFYSLNSTSSGGVSFRDNERVESFYDLGERDSEYRHEAQQAEAYVGWSKGLVDGFSRRFTVGLTQDSHRFSHYDESDYPEGELPDDRRLLYPFVGLEVVEDKFEKAKNLNQIGRTEDRYLGTRLSARLGAAFAGAGSDRNALLVAASAQTGFGTSKRSSLMLATDVSARVEAGGVQNFALHGSAKYFKRQSEKRLFHIALSASLGHNLDLDQMFTMGGESGLRGYPLRYQTGEKRAILTVEQRYFTDWYPFRLFHVGSAVFFDVGRVWGEAPSASTQSGLLRDVGFGLRIGNSRSGFGRMTHIDVAIPLDGDSQIDDIQFLVSTKKSF